MHLFLIFLWFFTTSLHPSTVSTLPPIPPTAALSMTNDPVFLKNVLVTSADGGKTWTDLTGNFPVDATPFSLLIDQKEMIIGTEDGLFKSSLGIPTQKWKQEETALNDVILFFPGKMGPYAVSQWNGIYQRQVGSALWTKVGDRLKDKVFFSMMEASNGNLIAGSELGLYTSDNQGQSWKHMYDKGGINWIMEDDGVLIACSLQGLLRSADGGKHWNLVLTGTTTPFRTRKVKDGIVAVIEGQSFGGINAPNEVMLSKDKGLTWKPMFASLPRGFKDVYDVLQVGEVFFACADFGIFRSVDQGVTWESVYRVPLDKGGIFKLFVQDKSLFALLAPGC